MEMDKCYRGSRRLSTHHEVSISEESASSPPSHRGGYCGGMGGLSECLKIEPTRAIPSTSEGPRLPSWLHGTLGGQSWTAPTCLIGSGRSYEPNTQPMSLPFLGLGESCRRDPGRAIRQDRMMAVLAAGKAGRTLPTQWFLALEGTLHNATVSITCHSTEELAIFHSTLMSAPRNRRVWPMDAR